MLSKNTKVIYKEMSGIIDFVCENYIVIQLPAAPDRKSPRLIVLCQDYKNVEIVKISTE
jgi:hypothetical protein